MITLEEFKLWLAFLAPLTKEPEESGAASEHPSKKEWQNFVTNLSDAGTDLEHAAAALSAIGAADDPFAAAKLPATADMLPPPPKKLGGAPLPPVPPAPPPSPATPSSASVSTPPPPSPTPITPPPNPPVEPKDLKRRATQARDLAQQATELAATAHTLAHRASLLAQRADPEPPEDTTGDGGKGHATTAEADAARAEASEREVAAIHREVKELRELQQMSGLGDEEKTGIQNRIDAALARLMTKPKKKGGSTSQEADGQPTTQDALNEALGDAQHSLETARDKVDGFTSPDQPTATMLTDVDLVSERLLVLRQKVEEVLRRD